MVTLAANAVAEQRASIQPDVERQQLLHHDRHRIDTPHLAGRAHFRAIAAGDELRERAGSVTVAPPPAVYPFD